jgi:hypothetical protein
MNDKNWISYADAADYGVSRRTLERYVRAGVINVWRRNSRWVLLWKPDVIRCFIPPVSPMSESDVSGRLNTSVLDT